MKTYFKTCNLNSFELGIIMLEFLQPSWKSQKNKVCMESSWQISLGTAQTKCLTRRHSLFLSCYPLLLQSPAVRLLASLNLSNRKHREQSFKAGSERYDAVLRLAFIFNSYCVLSS